MYSRKLLLAVSLVFLLVTPVSAQEAGQGAAEKKAEQAECSKSLHRNLWGGVEQKEYSDRAFLSAVKGYADGVQAFAKKVRETSKEKLLQEWSKDVEKDAIKAGKAAERLLVKLGGKEVEAYNSMVAVSTEAYKDLDIDVGVAHIALEKHIAGLHMGAWGLMHSKDPEVIKLSEEMVSDEAEGIAKLRVWLIQRSKK